MPTQTKAEAKSQEAKATKIEEVSPSVAIRSLLEDNKDKLAAILPAHLKTIRGYEDRMIKAALVAINNQPQLLKCTPLSIIQAVMRAAELGLDPSGTLGSGYLIAYGDQCVFSPGYRGLIDLATRGESRVLDIDAHVVYSKDKFEYIMSSSSSQDPYIVHEPPGLAEDRGDIIGVYMIARLRDGMKKYEVMSKRDVEKVKAKSKMSAYGAWKDFPEQMYRKVVIRRGINYLPLSPEVLSQIYTATHDDDEIFGLNFSKEEPYEQEIPQDGKKFGFGKKRQENNEDTGNVIDI